MLVSASLRSSSTWRRFQYIVFSVANSEKITLHRYVDVNRMRNLITESDNWRYSFIDNQNEDREHVTKRCLNLLSVFTLINCSFISTARSLPGQLKGSQPHKKWSAIATEMAKLLFQSNNVFSDGVYQRTDIPYPCLLHTVGKCWKDVNIFVYQWITTKIQFASECTGFVCKQPQIRISPLHWCIERVQSIKNVH